MRLYQQTALAEQVARRARAAWPELNLDMDPFVEHVFSLLDQNGIDETALRQLVVEDLYLAFGCSRGVLRALKAFAREYDADWRAVSSKLRVSRVDSEDARQILWDKLFLASSAAPMKILEYRGEGRLRHWFRAVAARVLLDGMRRAKREVSSPPNPLDAALDIAASNSDPELFGLRERYLEEFRSAFALAANSLEPDERNYLKCHYLMGMSSDQMAAAFSTHRATAARRVARARARLLSLTRDHLKLRLRATSGELDSIMRLFDGELSVSLSRLLE